MASAKISTPEGIHVEIEGTPAEVAATVEMVRAQLKELGGEEPSRSRKAKGGPVKLPDLVEQLKAEDFFKTPKGLGEVQKKLADLGHHYPVTTLSGSMQNQAKRRSLRRFKQEGKYVYVQ